MSNHSDGKLILVVGPSGAGKDSLIRGVAERQPELVVARRIVTRPSDPQHEDHDSLSEEDFAVAEAAEEFWLSWQAHGLSYALPHSVGEALVLGRDVIANVSRTVVEAARARWPATLVVEVTAPTDVLAERLAARGRDSDGAGRLERSVAVTADATVVNDGSLEVGVAALLRAMEEGG